MTQRNFYITLHRLVANPTYCEQTNSQTVELYTYPAVFRCCGKYVSTVSGSDAIPTAAPYFRPFQDVAKPTLLDVIILPKYKMAAIKPEVKISS